MEQETNDFSVKGYTRKSSLKTRIKDNGRMKTTFRTAARQVWIANSFSKQYAGVDEPYLKTTEGNQKMLDGNTLETILSCSSRPPGVKRRGTPEIFPMSSEMRKTLVLLGNLDLLPEEEKQKHDELMQAEKKKKLNSFRRRTQMRVIQPQRFIRSFRNGGKNAEKSTNELENINSTAESTLINSRAGKNTSSLSPKDEQTEENNDTVKLENILSNDKDDGRGLQEANKDSSRRRSTKNPWQKAIKRHQHGYVVPNASNPFFVRKRFSPSRREHFSNSWQPRSNFHEKFPSIKRSYSLGSTRTFSSEPAGLDINTNDYTEPINDGKSINEITDDIQERCSKWFEFRQKILARSWENKLI